MNLEASIKRIETKLSLINQAKSKKVWVSVRFIQKVTGWKRQDLKAARDQNIIEWRISEHGMQYNVNSIPDAFLINKP